MSNQATKKAVLYLRVSTDKQAESGTSIKTQEAACRIYTEKEGYQVIKVFSEEGESAKAWQRPVLLEMLHYLKERKSKIDVLIVHKLDRLSRNTDDQSAIMYKLQQAGVDLRSASENIDDTAIGKFMRSILWAVAEFDNAVRSERVRSTQYQRFQDGFWPFAPPSGYASGKDVQTNRSLPVPHEQYGQLITWAAKQRAAGVSYMDIAAALKRRGFRTRQGNAPVGQFLHKLLHNKFYIGVMCAYGEQLKGKHKPIISHDVWLKMRIVDGEASNPATQRQKYNPDFPLSQSLTCPECGQKLRGSYSTGKSGKRYPYYHHYNAECSRGRSYTRAIVHDAFMEALQDVKPDKHHLRVFQSAVIDLAKSKNMEQAGTVAQFERRLKDLHQQRQDVLDGIANDPRFELLPREEWLARKNRIDQAIYDVSVDQAKYAKTEVDVQKYLTRCFAAITDPAKRWQSYKRIEHKAEFARELFPEGVTFDGEKCRTPQISPLMQVLQQFPDTEDEIVAPRGIEPLF